MKEYRVYEEWDNGFMLLGETDSRERALQAAIRYQGECPDLEIVVRGRDDKPVS